MYVATTWLQRTKRDYNEATACVSFEHVQNLLFQFTLTILITFKSRFRLVVTTFSHVLAMLYTWSSTFANEAERDGQNVIMGLGH